MRNLVANLMIQIIPCMTLQQLITSPKVAMICLWQTSFFTIDIRRRSILVRGFDMLPRPPQPYSPIQHSSSQPQCSKFQSSTPQPSTSFSSSCHVNFNPKTDNNIAAISSNHSFNELLPTPEIKTSNKGRRKALNSTAQFERDDERDVTDNDEDQEVITSVAIIEDNEAAGVAKLSYPDKTPDATPMEENRKHRKRPVYGTYDGGRDYVENVLNFPLLSSTDVKCYWTSRSAREKYAATPLLEEECFRKNVSPKKRKILSEVESNEILKNFSKNLPTVAYSLHRSGRRKSVEEIAVETLYPVLISTAKMCQLQKTYFLRFTPKHIDKASTSSAPNFPFEGHQFSDYDSDEVELFSDNEPNFNSSDFSNSDNASTTNTWTWMLSDNNFQ
ncbi:hypothetical protein FQA39_LY06155 [Lamprigera yunnana]|nr:hypothetical protein FQA39_LY06155 [Lamprigera yunnana]